MNIPAPDEIRDGKLVTSILSDIALAMIEGKGSHTIDSVSGLITNVVVRELKDRGWFCECRQGVGSMTTVGTALKATGSTTTFSWLPMSGS